MNNEQEIKEEICEIGRRVYNREMVAANDGNFSVRLDDDNILCTLTGVSKGFISPDMICKIDIEGNIVETHKKWLPSTEMKMHLSIYAQRSDVQSVVHAHPQDATSYAIAGIPLVEKIMPEAIIFSGEVPTAKYGLPSTMKIPESIAPFLDDYNAILLENHDALTWGNSLMNAYVLMEGLEFYASLAYKAKMLGGAKELPPHEVQRLYDLRKKYFTVREKTSHLNRKGK